MSGTKSLYKIIYILGPGHCGSTLFDMILGSTAVAFSIGELAFYSHYLNEKPHIKIDNVDGFKCTCGKKARNCTFWKSVNKNIQNKNPIIKNRGYINTSKIFLNIISPIKNKFNFDIDVSMNVEVLNCIYKQAAKYKSNLKYLVDSSKDPRRLYELIRDPDIKINDIVVLYLVRDGRAYVNSYRKDIVNIDGLDKRNMFMSMVEWAGVHVASRRVIKKYKLKHRVVKYHDFVKNPEKYFMDIYKFLDVKADYREQAVIRKINSTKYHSLHGNPIRFNRVERIIYDLSWKTELSFVVKLITTILFYPFNKLWVFNNTSKKPFILR